MSVTFNYSKLRGRIKEKYKTETLFSECLGISSVSFSKELNNNVGFTQNEMLKSLELLEIEKTEVKEYFFATRIQSE